MTSIVSYKGIEILIWKQKPYDTEYWNCDGDIKVAQVSTQMSVVSSQPQGNNFLPLFFSRVFSRLQGILEKF